MSTYTTVQGDMWDSIAYNQMGSKTYTNKLMNLNSEYLDYYVFPAGITLALPEEETPVNESLPPWRTTG